MLIRSTYTPPAFRNNPGVGGVGAITSAQAGGPAGIDLRNKKLIALILRLASPGVADVSITYQTSHDGITFSTAAQTILASSNTTFSTTPTDENIVAMPDVLAPFILISITGLAGNNAGTKLTYCDLFFEENT